MDILSHGLWGAIAFGRRNRPSFWLAFVIGLAPDLLSFGMLWMAATLGMAEKPDFSHGTPPESTIPQYVHHLYNVTHSLVIFLLVFFLVWAFLKRPLWELGAWGLHVLVDVPTHSYAFFPTPILWPLFNWKFDGWQWTTPAILIPNYVLLTLCYAWFASQSIQPPTMTLRELLDWQWKGYPTYHRSRLNLLLHVVVVPLFMAANVGLIFGMFEGSWSWMLVSLVTMLVSVGMQGLGHLTEPVRPAPFGGFGEALSRIILEQWITFPRFVMSGGWLQALRQKGT